MQLNAFFKSIEKILACDAGKLSIDRYWELMQVMKF